MKEEERTMLNLAEDLILLALDDETGSFYRMTDVNFNLALVGALFMNLAILERIDVDQQNLFISSDEATGDVILDEILHLLAAPDNSCDTAELIRTVYNAIPNLRDKLLESLKQKGVVEAKEEKVFWLFHHRRYPVVNNKEEQEILGRIKDVVLQGEAPEQKDIVLISLLYVCDLLDKVFTKEELQTHCERLELLRSMDLIAHSVNKIIAEIQMMIASSFIA